MKIAKVYLDLKNQKFNRTFDYLVDDSIQIGQRIAVSFGTYKKDIEGLVVGFSDSSDYEVEIKTYLYLLDEEPIITKKQLELCERIAKRNCTLFYTIFKFFTSAVKVKRKNNKLTVYSIQPEKVYQFKELKPVRGKKQQQIIEILKSGPQKLSSLKEKIKPLSNSSLASLVEKGIIEEVTIPIFEDNFVQIEPKDKIGQQSFLVPSGVTTLSEDLYFSDDLEFSGMAQLLIDRFEIDPTSQSAVVFPTNSQAEEFSDYLSKNYQIDDSFYSTELKDPERYRFYKRVLDGSQKIVVGSGSVLFLPYKSLKTILFNECDNVIYSPTAEIHYDCLEIAQDLAKQFNALFIATDTVNSVTAEYKIQEGEWKKYPNLIEKEPLKIEAVDISYLNKREKLELLSDELKKAIDETLKAGKKVVLLFNRKGYYNLFYCKKCGHALECPECGTPLMSRKKDQEVECKACGYYGEFPKACPTCGSEFIKKGKLGIEQVGEQLVEAFPDAKVDLYFDRHHPDLSKTDIILATQSILFREPIKNVGLSAAVLVDLDFRFVDYKAPENALRLYTDFFKKFKNSRHIIQSWEMDKKFLSALAGESEPFIQVQNSYRELTKLPPYYNLYTFTLTADNAKLVNKNTQALRSLLQKTVEDDNLQVLKPFRVILKKGMSSRRFLVKTSKKTDLFNILSEFYNNKMYEEFDSTVSVVVNPSSFL